MLNWENKIHKKLRIKEVLGLLENIEEPTLRDIEILGLYWFVKYGSDFLKLRKSLDDLSKTCKYPFCSGHNIMTTFLKDVNIESKLNEEFFDKKLKELERLNRVEFLIDTIHKSYYSILQFSI